MVAREPIRDARTNQPIAGAVERLCVPLAERLAIARQKLVSRDLFDAWVAHCRRREEWQAEWAEELAAAQGRALAAPGLVSVLDLDTPPWLAAAASDLVWGDARAAWLPFGLLWRHPEAREWWWNLSDGPEGDRFALILLSKGRGDEFVGDLQDVSAHGVRWWW